MTSQSQTREAFLVGVDVEPLQSSVSQLALPAAIERQSAQLAVPCESTLALEDLKCDRWASVGPAPWDTMVAVVTGAVRG